MIVLSDTRSPLADLLPSTLIEELRLAFGALASGRALLPAQFALPFDNGGDIISYPSVLLDESIYALKLSPYIPRSDGSAIVTAWTLLFDLRDGIPVALVESKALTTHRTAATSALAVDLLADPAVASLSVVGSGPAALTHVDYLRAVRPFSRVTMHSRTPVDDRRHDVEYSTDVAAAADADVVALCTSAAESVIDVTRVRPGALVTSISTNAPVAHEIEPGTLSRLNVYIDYLPTAGAVPEFRLAEQAGWSIDSILGDLPSLVARGTPPGHDPTRATFFRSIGQGIEDAVIARLVLKKTATSDPTERLSA